MKRKNRGFTLVELLVVLAIIGVLCTLLLPAVFGVREKGNGALCASNLRQHGIAIELYAADHDGEIPTVPQLVNYLDDPDVFVCPEDKRDEALFTAKDTFKRSYTTHPVTPKSNRPSDITGIYKEQVILVESGQAGLKEPSKITIDDVTIRHGPITYALHLDGHVYGYTEDQIAQILQALWGRTSAD